MTKKVDVAAGVVFREDGCFLLGQRAPDTFYAGYWEFPGGKVEPGETPAQALVRELDEELGIRVARLNPWLTREHHYEHAHVRLHFFEVAEWSGEVDDRVHSALSWERPEQPDVAPMLPANGPILKSLRLPRWMAITHAGEVGVEPQLVALDRALDRGVRLIQVREPAMTAAQREDFAGHVTRLARPYGAIVVVNGDERAARASGADGVHLSARQLMALGTRPDGEWVGASCHSREELEHAARLGFDYALLGSVLPTLSHPGQPALGWSAFERLVADLPIPVLALGGLGHDDMAAARAAGAHGIAAIRASWTQS